MSEYDYLPHKEIIETYARLKREEHILSAWEQKRANEIESIFPRWTDDYKRLAP